MIGKEAILDYIPHREPFVMIDNLLSASAEKSESDFLILPQNLLVRNGLFQATGIIENMAQTCAASFALLGGQAGEAPKIGYIGAVSRLEVFELPPVNAVIRTVIMPLHQLGNIYLVRGESFWEGRILLGCEMKIVVSQ